MRAKRLQIHEKFDETNSELEKKATSLRPKKHQAENASEASDFLCTRFQMSTKHLEPVTTIRKQYMFLQKVEKKETTSPSRKQEKNALKNQVIFHQSAKSRLFLPNPQNIMFVRTNHSQKTRRKNSLSWNPRPHKSLKKNSILVNFHIWHKISSFKTTHCLFWASIDHNMSIDKHIEAFRHIESKKTSNT